MSFNQQRQPPDGKIRQSQAMSTYGPGAMIDLLDHAVIVTGLGAWRGCTEGFDEPRLRAYLRKRNFELRFENPFVYPPAGDEREPSYDSGIRVLEFPRWFVCQHCRTLTPRGRNDAKVKDRYVHDCQKKKALFVPVRFVMACPNGHLQEFPWRSFVHDGADCSGHDLKLLEGPSGDFSEVHVRCQTCDRHRSLAQAAARHFEWSCEGRRPWLGLDDRDDKKCEKNLRLLVRTSSSGYFPRIVSALSFPEPETARTFVEQHIVALKNLEPELLVAFKKLNPELGAKMSAFSDADILSALADHKAKKFDKRLPLRSAEFMQLKASEPEQAGALPNDDEKFFARTCQNALPAGLSQIVLVHRLREVRIQTGFTRFEASAPDLQGETSEVDLVVEPAPLARHINWLPGVEVFGEGFFIQLDEGRVQEWEKRPAVIKRIEELHAGYLAWRKDRPQAPDFYGGRYYLLHTLSHLLIQAVSLDCGYSAAAIRERIYCASALDELPMAGILLSTGATGSEGTLGGLVEQGRRLRQHLGHAYDMGTLCSSDPVCAAHRCATDPTHRYLEGAACHGCVFVAEPSCEQFNKFLDRSMVFPTIGLEDVAFFKERPE